MPTPILEARGLKKTFGTGRSIVEAVRGIDLVVPEGQCLGLLGPNGAGKTTTVEMLETIQDPTAGEVLYRGERAGHGYKARIGIQFQQTHLQDFLRVQEVLETFQCFYEKRADIAWLLDVCQLGELRDRDTKKLSGGQRQRVLLALALVNDPEIVFLDEPTTGLDPQARFKFWELVETIKGQGRTVILTTHYMEEAERLCDEVAIVDQGRIVEKGSPKSLLSKHFAASRISLRVAGEGRARRVLGELQGRLRGFQPVEEHADGGTFFCADQKQLFAELLALGVAPDALNVETPTLEDLFLKLTGKDLRA